ncbi:MAG: tetratricopeptide repeat protein [Steroidobacteraceae bacterium]
MIVFILAATLLTILAAGLIVVPLTRPLRAPLAPARWAALLSCLVLVGGSVGLYLKFSNWSWQRNPGVASPESPIVELVHHLARDPRDLDAWLRLGKSYVVVQEYPLAVRAFEHADRLSDGRSPAALIGEAEALILIHDSSLEGRAGRLIERALVLDPNSPKALFFGAAEAMRRGDLTLARARFARLLAMNPPPDVQTVLRQEIAAIDAKIGAKKPQSADKSLKPASS